MHTVIRLDNGVLELSLQQAGEDVQESRWRAAVEPGVLLLRALGDGTLFVPHQPADLADS